MNRSIQMNQNSKVKNYYLSTLQTRRCRTLGSNTFLKAKLRMMKAILEWSDTKMLY